MKKALNIISLVVICVSVVWLWVLYSPTNDIGRQTDGHPAETVQSQAPEFIGFAPDEKIMVDFEEGHEILEPLSTREQMDQVKDWLIYTILSESGLPTETISQIIFDLPPVRHGYIEPVANFEYGETRSLLIGDGRIMALVPAFKRDGNPIPENAVKDYLVHIADEHRKNVGEKPSRLILFKYEIDLDEQFALVWRQQSLDCADFFTDTYGYFESEVSDRIGFQHFMEKIDDITFARLNQNKLVLGGRKLQGERHGGIRVEDVAAIWQSEIKIQDHLERFNSHWQKMADQLNARWAGKSYSGYLGVLSRTQYEQKWQALENAMYKARRKEKLVDASGFSLDPKYDYIGLKSLFDNIKPVLQKLWTKGTSVIQPEDINKAAASLNGADAQSESSYPEVPLLRLVDKLRKSNSNLDLVLGELLFSEIKNYRYQAARYDGYLKGTEVGMTLFYTDLLAKLWAIDYMQSAPDQVIDDFVTLTAANLSTIYMQESIELPSCRLWFGHKSKGFQVADEGDSLLFARNATRIFAASSDPLEPGVEVPASARFSTTLEWWNHHYEEVAHYEPQYQKLNQIMKWSLLIGWLNNKKQADTLGFLKSVEVDRSNWFPEWAVKRQGELKYTQWQDVSFFDRGFSGAETEVMPILYSEPYYLFGSQRVLSGGVSLAGKNVFKDLKPITPSIQNVIRRPNLSYASSRSNLLKTLEGVSYRFRKLPFNRMEIMATPAEGAMLRGTSSQLVRSEFQTVISRKNSGLFNVVSRTADADIGTFQINRAADGFRLAWQKGDIDAGHLLGNTASKSRNIQRMLTENPNVEAFIKTGEGDNYLVREIHSGKLLRLSQESAPTLNIEQGWTSRVSDVYKGGKNINLRWVEKTSALDELGEQGAIAIESVSEGKLIMRNVTNENFIESSVPAKLQWDGMSIEARVNPKTGELYLPKRALPDEIKTDPFRIKDILPGKDFRQVARLAEKKHSFTYEISGPVHQNLQTFTQNIKQRNYWALARGLRDSPADFVGMRDRVLKEEIAYIDRLMATGNPRKAYYASKNAIRDFGRRPGLARRMETAEIGRRLKQINHSENDYLVFTVKDLKSGYALYDESGRPLYQGDKISELVNRIDHRLPGDQAGTVYLDMKDFSSSDKVEAFASSIRFQRSKHPGLSVKTFCRKGGDASMQDLFFAGKIKLVKPLRVTRTDLVIQGRFKGLYRTVLEGTARIKGTLKSIVIEVYAKTRKLADEFVSLFNLRFASAQPAHLLPGMKSRLSADPRFKCPAEIVNEVRRELRIKYKLDEDDLVIKFGNEFGETEVVSISGKWLPVG